jgi:hypothetical protein
MRAAGLNVTVFEKADNVGSAWRRRSAASTSHL